MSRARDIIHLIALGGAAPGHQGIAPGSTNYAAFGDSVMWGQGVARPQRFSLLTVHGIRALPNQPQGRMLDRSRSDANIKVREGSDREDFADNYPIRLPTDTAVRAFLEGDESAAKGLYGEVPCTFPTVRWQVRNLADSIGRDIKVALLSGGANDINFVAVLDPRENQDTFVDKFAGDIRVICYQDTLELLYKARQKMPNAPSSCCLGITRRSRTRPTANNSRSTSGTRITAL
jgi:hypothetical protein